MPSGFEIFELLHQATEDVLKEINSAVRSQRIKPKMGPINLELDAALSQSTVFMSSSPEADSETRLSALREQIQSVVQTVPLATFRRDKKFKAIREEYKYTQDQIYLIEAFGVFFVENDLYRDVEAPKSMLEQVSAENLQHIAYEAFG